MRQNEKTLLKRSTLTILIGLTLCFIILSALFYHKIYMPSSYNPKTQLVRIPRGATSGDIAKMLYGQQIIRSELAFRLYTKFKRCDFVLRAGTFRFSASYSIAQIVWMLTHNWGTENLIRVTIPEGYRIQEIAEVLSQQGLVDKNNFIAYISENAKSDFIKRYPFLHAISDPKLEGVLFPETYFFDAYEHKENIVNLFFEQFDKKIVKLWHEAKQFSQSPATRLSFFEVMTLASIIEKEARKPEEMPIIASVFYNRLKKKMPLGADPTIIYALGLSWKKQVTFQDLKTDSPYNTYTHPGLPPTPIASFGEAAFRAALYPAQTHYLYFVAQKDGTHYFTKTYKEHLQAQKRIQQQ